MNSARAKLRQHFKQQRRDIDPRLRAQATLAINQHLIKYFEQHAHSAAESMVAAYMATSDEVDLNVWLTAHLAYGGRAVLPRIQSDNAMTFYPYTATTEFERNRYGISEPVVSTPAVRETDIDVVLVPLVAFDEAGTRLGMGGGYYDRYLPGLRTNTTVVGVSFACQRSIQPLPKADWDIPLQTVVTENGVLELSENNNHG